MKYLAVICVLAASVSMVSAAIVDYTVTYGGGSFEVTATVAPGNGGLSFFALKFGDNTTSLTNSAPTGTAWDGSDFGTIVSMGFSQSECPTALFPNDLAGGQNVMLDPGFMVYGIGQLPGPAAWPATLPGGLVYAGGKPADVAAPVLLGSGTYSGAAPTVSETAANVFTSDSGTDATSVDSAVEIVPEPMTMTLLALGGLALIRRRKA